MTGIERQVSATEADGEVEAEVDEVKLDRAARATMKLMRDLDEAEDRLRTNGRWPATKR